MNQVDSVYLNLLKDILYNGVEKDTRAGRVKSVFGRQIRFDLKNGIPLLTTKKVFTKGIIHELLWFLQRPYNSHGSMNIEKLIRNNVHIWDDDAYRWFKSNIVPQFKGNIRSITVCVTDDEIGERPCYEYWIENDIRRNDYGWLENITKEEFLDLTLQRVQLLGPWMSKYRFGDLGPIYGKQWRSFGESGTDQINDIIRTLKNNPNDRRMLCVAFNPDQIEDMALPPCHVMFQFYTRELSKEERKKWGEEHQMTLNGVPKYGLSCMFFMRSNDVCCGTPFNWVQYSILTYMIANIVGMVPDELIYSCGDCHIYLNHTDGVTEQLSRSGSDIQPKLRILGEHSCIEDFKYEDFEIKDYYPDPPIKFQLNVG